MASFFKQKLEFTDRFQMLGCMKTFSKNEDTSLNAQEFDAMARSLLTVNNGMPNELPVTMSADLFTIFDRNKDRKIDEAEFETVWNGWIKPLLKPVSALIIVDVQNDFIDGSLALKNCPAKQDGANVVPVINDMLLKNKFNVVVYSLDWHPENHISFFENLKLYKLSDKYDRNQIELYDTVHFAGPPEIEQKLWPRHCVEDTWGSKLHKDLKIVENAIFIYKGKNPKFDSYSAFWDNMKQSKTCLDEELRSQGVTHVYVCGIAMEFCVSFTALDALELGYATIIVQNATQGTDYNVMENMRKNLLYKHCCFASSDTVENLASGKNIKTEFAYILAKHLESNEK